MAADCYSFLNWGKIINNWSHSVEMFKLQKSGEIVIYNKSIEIRKISTALRDRGQQKISHTRATNE